TMVTPIALSCSSHSVLPTRPARLVLRLALAAGVARKPVSKAPSVPPTPCTPKVSSASSYLNHALSLVQARKGTTPARTPINTAAARGDKPGGGRDQDKPAPPPGAEAKHGGLAPRDPPQHRPRRGGDRGGRGRGGECPRGDPARGGRVAGLKPYQPTHSIPVP